LSNQVGTKINKYAITAGQGIANLQNLGFTIGTSFAPKTADKTKTAPTPGIHNDLNGNAGAT
jgi:hypothetical protein